MMYPAFHNPASCEIRVDMRFLHIKNMNAAEIQRELCVAVYSQNVMGDGTVRKWRRMFKDERRDVRDDERTGRSEELVQSVEQQDCERRHFTISELSCEYPQISRTLLYDIIRIRLGYHKFCARLVPKMLTGAHKKQRMVPALTF
jgi:hypothetical protein